ncbi:O-antigen translocase [Gangjinia marincola]|uniref:O-antigen translocase n=1 Tax=Gangjinia marincola TaxID=578463 RepID=A0ABN1MDS7_9FLAO
MNRILQRIRSNVLLKVTSVNSLSVGIKIITGFVVSKALAIYVRPEGMALIGNLRDLITMIQSFSLLGIKNGVIKYVAEYKKKPIELREVLSTSIIIGISSSLLLSVGIVLSAGFLSDYLFSSQAYKTAIRVLGICIPGYAAVLLLLDIINGFSDVKRFVLINILGNLFGFALTFYLIVAFQLQGAIYGLILSPILLLIVTAILFKQGRALNQVSILHASMKMIKNLGSYSLMALLSSLVLPFIYIAIRTMIIDRIGQDAAGYWTSMNRLASYYFMFISSLLTLHVLPKLSGIHTAREFRREIFHFYKTILPFVAIGMVLIYITRDFIVQLVFTQEFLPMTTLFKWQLAGDFLKIMGIVVAHQFLAKNMLKHFIVTEILSITVLGISSYVLVSLYGVEGATMAHAFTYAIYLIVIWSIFRKQLFFSLKT